MYIYNVIDDKEVSITKIYAGFLNPREYSRYRRWIGYSGDRVQSYRLQSMLPESVWERNSHRVRKPVLIRYLDDYWQEKIPRVVATGPDDCGYFPRGVWPWNTRGENFIRGCARARIVYECG